MKNLLARRNLLVWIVIFSIFIYAYLFYTYSQETPTPIVLFYFLPLLFGAHIWGIQGGLILGLVSFPINLSIQYFWGEFNLSTDNLINIAIIQLVFILTGVMFGAYRDSKNKKLAGLQGGVHSENNFLESQDLYQTLVNLSPDAIFVHVRGIIIFRNAKAQEMLQGKSDKDIIGMQVMDLIHPDFKDVVLERIEMMTSEGNPTKPLEEKIIRLDGTTFYADGMGSPVHFEGQKAIQVILRDVSERKEKEETLKQAEQRYRTVANYTYDWEYWIDLNGDLIYVSPSCERITGYTPDEFITNPKLLTEIILPEDQEIYKDHKKGTLLNPGIHEVIFQIITKQNEIRWIEHTCQNVFTEDGEFIGFRVSNRDATVRVTAEQALKESEERYRQFVEQAGECVYSISSLGYFEYINPFGEKLTGYSIEELQGMLFLDLVQEDYKESVQDFYLNQRNQKILKTEKEIPMISKEGNQIWVSQTVNLVLENGEVTGLQGIVRDITENVKIRELLSLQATALNSAASGIVITDQDGIILWANPAFTDLTYYSTEEALGKHTKLLKSGHHDNDFYKSLWDTILSGTSWHGRMINRRKDGSLYDEEMTIAPVYNDAGIIHRFVAIKQDISQKVLAEKQMEYIATHDSLTKLLNRPAFYVRLEHALAAGKRENKMVAVLFIDLDNFKYVNDTYGHEKGDQLLIEIAEGLKNSVRETDTVARLAGDEFTMILDKLTSLEDTDQVVKKIFSVFHKKFDIDGNKFQIAASMGVSLFPDHSDDIETLIRMADQAMYQVKKAGGNNFGMYDRSLNE